MQSNNDFYNIDIKDLSSYNVIFHHFQSVREEEETAATEKAEVEMEEEKNRLTIELENEQRVTLGRFIKS